MKTKLLAGIAAAALVTGIGMTAVKAEETAAPAQTAPTCTYVDADGDGICDNRGTGQCSGSYVDANNDGICDNAGSGQCRGRGLGNGTGCGSARRAGWSQNN